MSDPCPVGVESASDRNARRLRVAMWVAVLVGVALRLRRYASGSSLWGDETLLAINLVGRSWSELLRPLTLGQVAPVGFLWLEKLVITTFGASELALRLLPFLASAATLFLFRRVALALLPPLPALGAVLFVALAEPHVHYAAAVKQYSFDVLFAVLLLDRALAVLLPARPSRRARWLLAAAGGVAQLFSHASVLTEAAVGGALLIAALRDRPRAQWRWPAAIGAGWFALFVVLYFAFLRDAARNPYLRDFWAGSFAPGFPTSGADLRWYATRLAGYCSDPLGATPAFLAAACVLLGLFFRTEPADHGARRLLLVGPLLIALVAAMAGAYPFSTGLDADLGSGRFNWNGRLLLFTTPGIVLLGGAGLRAVADRFGGGGRVAALVIGGTLLAVPAFDALRNFAVPPRLQEIGPAVAFLRDRIRPGDTEFVREIFLPSYRYYARRHGVALPLEPFEVSDAVARKELRRRIAALPAGRRVWLFYVDGMNERSDVAAFSVETEVGRVAALRASFEAERVHVWLYEVDRGAAWRRDREGGR